MGRSFIIYVQRYHLMMFSKARTNWEYVILNNWKTLSQLYDMEIHQKTSTPNYQKLKTMVNRRTDQKLRLRNFDARHGKIETGAVVKSRQGLSVVVREEEENVTSGKKKASVRRVDRCSFQHKSHKRATPTPKAAPSSEPSMTQGRFASRKKSVRGRSQTWQKSSTTVQILWEEYLHANVLWMWASARVPILQKNETGCEAGDKCLFPHYKIDEQPNK